MNEQISIDVRDEKNEQKNIVKPSIRYFDTLGATLQPYVFIQYCLKLVMQGAQSVDLSI